MFLTVAKICYGLSVMTTDDGESVLVQKNCKDF